MSADFLSLLLLLKNVVGSSDGIEDPWQATVWRRLDQDLHHVFLAKSHLDSRMQKTP